MCVVNLKKRVKGPVTAWKLVYFSNRRWEGLQGFRYKIGKLHTTNKAKGFQAFVNREDAEQARREKWEGFAVRKVLLYNAAQGIIEHMDGFSDGKQGWSALKIRLLKFRKN